jgi:hypothetical protein
MISKMAQWGEKDESFDHKVFYYEILEMLWKRSKWSEGVLEWWTMYVFFFKYNAHTNLFSVVVKSLGPPRRIPTPSRRIQTMRRPFRGFSKNSKQGSWSSQNSPTLERRTKHESGHRSRSERRHQNGSESRHRPTV